MPSERYWKMKFERLETDHHVAEIYVIELENEVQRLSGIIDRASALCSQNASHGLIIEKLAEAKPLAEQD